MAVPIPDRAYLSRKEAAAYLTGKWFPIAPSTLNVKASKATGPFYRLMGGAAVYTREDLDAWAKAQPRDPKPNKTVPAQGALSQSFR
jgi:hypothetical protein